MIVVIARAGGGRQRELSIAYQPDNVGSRPNPLRLSCAESYFMQEVAAQMLR
jgi:hypothetical protein